MYVGYVFGLTILQKKMPLSHYVKRMLPVKGDLYLRIRDF